MTQYRTQTVTLPDSAAKLTVRESVGLDVLDSAAIYPELTYNRKSKRDLSRARQFADAVLRSSTEGLDWWVDIDSAQDGELQKAFEAWQTLSSADLVTWVNALSNVNKVVHPNS